MIMQEKNLIFLVIALVGNGDMMILIKIKKKKQIMILLKLGQ
jgi:hypothetical protein